MCITLLTLSVLVACVFNIDICKILSQRLILTCEGTCSGTLNHNSDISDPKVFSCHFRVTFYKL
jgi:hypothetical protein